MSLQIQFLTLSLMACSGVVLGIAYDFIEVLVREFRIKRWVSAIIDIGYWLAATLFVFQVLVYANYGQVRIFIFIGLLLGVMFYFYIWSRYVRLTITWVIHFIVRLLQWLIRIVRLLIIRPILYLYRLLLIVLGFFMGVSMFIAKIMVQWFRHVWKWIMKVF
jgi:spore cortex biosynthesis protein YabQ